MTFHVVLASVNFLWMFTRSNIAFAVNVITMRQTTPMQLNMKQLKRLLRYLNGTMPLEITFGNASMDNVNYDMKVLSDSDWASHTTAR
jgi:hypothetical protein